MAYRTDCRVAVGTPPLPDQLDTEVAQSTAQRRHLAQRLHKCDMFVLRSMRALAEWSGLYCGRDQGRGKFGRLGPDEARIDPQKVFPQHGLRHDDLLRSQQFHETRMSPRVACAVRERQGKDIAAAGNPCKRKDAAIRQAFNQRLGKQDGRNDFRHNRDFSDH